MKYLVLVGDGMGDRPCPELGGQTPLQYAATPNMDRMAAWGWLGLAHTIPDDCQPGSDTANMSLMGINPSAYHCNRGPIEAASLGLDLKSNQAAFRCNLVQLEHNDGRVVMADYASGHITSAEAAQLIAALNEQMLAASEGADLCFYPGVSYRHILLWQDGPLEAVNPPPHDLLGQVVDDCLRSDGPLAPLADLARRSWPVLSAHPVNILRQQEGKRPANSIWLWGQGLRPAFPTLQAKYGLNGLVVSAVDLIRGIGVLLGLEVVLVPGATGFLDTNYQGKVEATLRGLAERDLALLHVEAPDEAGHSGILQDKIQAIEDFDQKVVGPILAGLQKLGPHRVLLATDHYTPLSIRTHSREPIPFVLWDSGQAGSGGQGYNECAAAASGLLVRNAYELFSHLLDGSAPGAE